MKLPKVTFVIATLNAMHCLPGLIKSIKKQNYPPQLIEIIVADAFSTDGTRKYLKSQKIRVIDNPAIIHETGKSLAAGKATGNIIFYTDADNELAEPDWIRQMINPHLSYRDIIGFLPQTTADPRDSSLNRYFGHLFTDPFTWFVYGYSANPLDYHYIYKPLRSTPQYHIYRFSKPPYPLFGLSQGTGTISKFKRKPDTANDDMLAGLNIMKAGPIAYVPNAFIYHHHINSIRELFIKYSWRVRNNFKKDIKNMGFVYRRRYLTKIQHIKTIIYIPYAFSLIIPSIHAVIMVIRFKTPVMLWHPVVSFVIALIIIKEIIFFVIYKPKTGIYGSS